MGAVMTVDQDLSLPQALLKLGQIVTTVGYGSNPPTVTGMKIFHELHGMWAVTELGDVLSHILDKALLPCYYKLSISDKNDEYLTGYGEDDVVLGKVYRLLPLAVNLVV